MSPTIECPDGVTDRGNLDWSEAINLRVDILDSANCGGPCDIPQDRSTPPAQIYGGVPGELNVFEITVEGRVEMQDRGYDQVFVNDLLFFGSEGCDNGCAMKAKSASQQVGVPTGGSIVLTYDTVDALFHVGAYAEITQITFVKRCIIKVDLDCDIDNDGDIDDDDEAGEESGLGEIVFVDKDGAGLDPSSGEDDLQLMELTFEPSDLGQGVAWFTYDSDKVQLYKDDTEADTSKIDPATESSPNWNLESGDTIPTEIYVRGLESTDEGESFDIKFWWKKGSAECTDKILTTVTDEVGHYAYFRGIRDHLGENQSRVYMDEIEMAGGFATGPDFKLVAVRRDKSTISVIDAKANNWKSIDEVKAAKSGATVIINGTFFTARGGQNEFGQKTEGTVVNGGSEITNISEPVEADRRPAYKGYFGQKADGSISWARNTEANTVTIDAAASGLAAFIPKNAGESYTDIIDEINEIHGSQYRSALAHIGYANGNAEDLVFLFFTSSATASDFPSNIDRAPLFEDLVTSGASMCYGLDGSGSIGVAHRNLDGTLGIVVRGNKHTWLAWRVNNYFVIDVEE